MADYETFIGYNDVKSIPVAFYAQRSTTFPTVGTVITYDAPVFNLGNALNTVTGVFTAPVGGTYFFSFKAHGNAAGSNAEIRVNGVNAGITWGESVADEMPISATVRLLPGDRVEVWLTGGSILDNNRHFTQFTGFLLEQDLDI